MLSLSDQYPTSCLLWHYNPSILFINIISINNEIITWSKSDNIKHWEGEKKKEKTDLQVFNHLLPKSIIWMNLS